MSKVQQKFKGVIYDLVGTFLVPINYVYFKMCKLRKVCVSQV